MLEWITNNIHTILVILTPLVGALITWAVRTHFKVKDNSKNIVSLRKELKDTAQEIKDDISKTEHDSNDKVSDLSIKMDTLIDGLREDLKEVKTNNELMSNQTREELKGIQLNIRELTLSVTKLLGYLEGKEIIKSEGIR